MDLGCGNGRIYSEVQKTGAEYIGVDISENLVGIAQERFPEARFQKADALKLPFPDSSFDKVYSIAVLHHIPSKRLRKKFLEEAGRVLKGNGFLILTAWRFHQKKEIFLLIKYTILKLLGKTKMDFKDVLEPWGNRAERYYHCFSLRELRKLVKEAGFGIEEAGIVKNERGTRQNFYVIAQPL